MSNYHADLNKQGLRGYLEFVKANHPNQLLCIAEPVKSK